MKAHRFFACSAALAATAWLATLLHTLAVPHTVSAQVFSQFLQTRTPDSPVAPSHQLADEEVTRIMQVINPIFQGAITLDTAPGLLRLAFHDSGTFNGKTGKGGMNGSIRFELQQGVNVALAQPLAVAQAIQQSAAASGAVLSLADVIALAGAAAVFLVGGPSIAIPLGRTDALQADAAGQLPQPSSSADQLIALFGGNGYTIQDLVALSGAHTIGQSHATDPKGMLDPATPALFDNSYYRMLLQGGGSFPSDRGLASHPQTAPLVAQFAADQKAFFQAFTAAYQKLCNQGVIFV
ncbi:hypothetical protein WJX72_010887 [[Myrmecia] bisecta]|uniref:L-ascorbate peroxidase n=1 Tax=[Myrmecia] bisecta TaxID=41462 RepID=A0AAW1P7U4_9CHLO